MPPSASRDLKRALRLRVFQVLNLQLQLLDAHVPLVEELSQPADFLLLLVELHEQLWMETQARAGKMYRGWNPRQRQSVLPTPSSAFFY